MPSISLRHALALILVLALTPVAPAAGFRTLHSFRGSDGDFPQASLIAIGSKLYGTTNGGGVSGAGTIFSINLNGSGFTPVYSFGGSLGEGPTAGLTFDGSKLYGTTWRGGAEGTGTIFSINPDGSDFQTLHAFRAPDGSGPYAGLTSVGSKLYGTTTDGGATQAGTIYSLNSDGTGFYTLHSFNVSDGAGPYTALTAVGSKLYGTTKGGGIYSKGTIFSINQDGSDFQSLHSFNDWEQPSSLIAVGSRLYGTTINSGNKTENHPFGLGTVFSIGQDGLGFETLFSFNGHDGAFPQASLTLVDSRLYGTTTRGGREFNNSLGNSGIGTGTIFSISPASSDFLNLFDFDPFGRSGRHPMSSLTAVGSTLFGTSVYGGAYGKGTVFSLTVPEAAIPEAGSWELSLSLFILLILLRCSQRWWITLRSGKSENEITNKCILGEDLA